MQGPYADHILDARDICSNCFRTVRVERLDPTREGFAGELESHYERRKRTTTIEFAPHEYPPRSKGVFCQCGVEGSHERLWNPTDISEQRVKSLIKNALHSLNQKDVTLKPKETAAYILHCWSETEDADKAFSKGIEMGLVASAAASANTNQHTEHEVDG